MMKKGKTMNESEKEKKKKTRRKPNLIIILDTQHERRIFDFKHPLPPPTPLLGYFRWSTMPQHVYTCAHSPAHTLQRVSFISIIIFL